MCSGAKHHGAQYGFAVQCQADSRVNRKELKPLLPEAYQVLAITSSLAILACLSQQIKTLEKAVSKRLKHTPSYEQLLTVDGIGTILAQTIALETGKIGRFPTVGGLYLVLPLCEQYQTEQWQAQGQGNVKNGNLYLGVGVYGSGAVCHRFNPHAQRFLPTQTPPRAPTTRSWRVNLWPISCHGPTVTSCETSCPLRRRKRLAESGQPLG